VSPRRKASGRLAEAAAQHPDQWAKASAAEDLGVLHARHADQDHAIHHLTQAIGGYQLTGATADTARVRRRLRKLNIGSRVDLARIVLQQTQQGPRGPHHQTC
jgi:hypothetical protein